MDQLRLPLFIVAVVALALAVLVELGAPEILRRLPPPPGSPAESLRQQLAPEVAERLDEADPNELDALSRREKPPGLAIRALALIDGLALFTVLLIGAALVIPGRIQGQAQGVATLIFALLILVASIIAIFAALSLALLMIALLLAVPFGTITYMVLYGSFNRGAAQVALGLIFALKLGFVVALVLAQQRFLRNRGLVLITLTSLLATVVVSWLHGLPPGFLVSITDAVAAIIVAVLAAIWAIVLLIGAIVALLKGLNLTRAGG